MSLMEAMIRDEIAWHEDRIAQIAPWKTRSWKDLITDHRTRLVPLAAALSEQNDAGHYDNGFCAGLDAAVKAISTVNVSDDPIDGNPQRDIIERITAAIRAITEKSPR